MKKRRFAALALGAALLAAVLPARGAEPREVRVSTEEELEAALASHTRVVLEDRAYYVHGLWADEVEDLTVVGSGPNSAVVSTSPRGGVFFLRRSRNVTLENLTLRYEVSEGEPEAAVVTERSDLTLKGCTVSGGRQGLAVMWNSTLAAEDCTITDSAAGAVFVSMESDVTLRGCSIVGNGGRGQLNPDGTWGPADALLDVEAGCSLGVIGCAVGGNQNTALLLRGENSVFNTEGCFYWDNGWPEEENLTAVEEQLPQRPADGALAFSSGEVVGMGDELAMFQMYALQDDRGYATNYVRLRDLAIFVSGTEAQFDVTWNGETGEVEIAAGVPYTVTAIDTVPYHGNMHYVPSPAAVLVDGERVDLEGILIQDEWGGGYTYYKLRDIARAVGFNVRWTPEMIWVEPGTAYDPDN